MLSSSLRLLIFLLCVSVYACNARRLGFVTLQSRNNEVQFIGTDVDDGANMGKPDQQGQAQVEINGSHMENHDEFRLGAKTMAQKLLNALSDAKQTTSRLYSGHEITTSFEDDLQKTTITDQGLRRHGRSILGTPFRDAEQLQVQKNKNLKRT